MKLNLERYTELYGNLEKDINGEYVLLEDVKKLLNKDIKFKARYIDIQQNECGWLFWNRLGHLIKIEYDDGEISTELTMLDGVNINDINENTIELINE